MRHIHLLSVFLLTAVAAVAAGRPAHADEFDSASGQLTDRYIGGNDNGYFNAVTGDDSIGSSKFDIDSSGVTISGDRDSGKLVFRIDTNYVNDLTASGTRLGDLFFSIGAPGVYSPDLSGDGSLTGGWYGLSDDWSTGTQFAYGINLEGDLTGTGSTASLYAIDATAYTTGAILESDDFFGTTGNHRNGQEVRVDTTYSGNTKETSYTASWSVVTGVDDYLLFTLEGDLGALGLLGTGQSEIAWRWAMTCGNDSVENSFTVQPVPEPGTLALLGLGFAGIGAARRRRKARADA